MGEGEERCWGVWIRQGGWERRNLKLGAALCTRGTDYKGRARGCSGCKMTPWKWSCKMQVTNP